MLLNSLGDTIARVANCGISDEDCNQMIENACQKAADEVRTRLNQAREREIERVRSQKERDAFDKIEVKARAELLARANADAERRQAELKAFEDSGQRRQRGYW